jgi:hypothetical protein
MHTLTKHSTVMHRTAPGLYASDEETVTLSADVIVGLGDPDVVTVSVVAGDRLND